MVPLRAGSHHGVRQWSPQHSVIIRDGSLAGEKLEREAEVGPELRHYFVCLLFRVN